MSRWCSSGKAPLERTSWRPGPRYRHRRRAGGHGRLWGGHGEDATRRTGRGARRSAGGEFRGTRRRWRRIHGGGGRRVRPYPRRPRLLPVATGCCLVIFFGAVDRICDFSLGFPLFLRRGRQFFLNTRLLLMPSFELTKPKVHEHITMLWHADSPKKSLDAAIYRFVN